MRTFCTLLQLFGKKIIVKHCSRIKSHRELICNMQVAFQSEWSLDPKFFSIPFKKSLLLSSCYYSFTYQFNIIDLNPIIGPFLPNIPVPCIPKESFLYVTALKQMQGNPFKPSAVYFVMPEVYSLAPAPGKFMANNSEGFQCHISQLHCEVCSVALDDLAWDPWEGWGLGFFPFFTHCTALCAHQWEVQQAQRTEEAFKTSSAKVKTCHHSRSTR